LNELIEENQRFVVYGSFQTDFTGGAAEGLNSETNLDNMHGDQAGKGAFERIRDNGLVGLRFNEAARAGCKECERFCLSSLAFEATEDIRKDKIPTQGSSFECSKSYSVYIDALTSFGGVQTGTGRESPYAKLIILWNLRTACAMASARLQACDEVQKELLSSMNISSVDEVAKLVVEDNNPAFGFGPFREVGL
ncbi:hypothetical protein T492DRAFT_1123040, partial [Pavlovales sp. CCMP2436]